MKKTLDIYSFAWDDGRAPHEVFAGFCRSPYSLFFDSANPAHELSRYSYIAFEPREIIEAKNGQITVTSRERQFSIYGDPFTVIAERMEELGPRKRREGLPPFQGGAAGFFGYDLARSLENLPKRAVDNPAMPDMAVGIYDQVFAFDHKKNKGWFIVHAEDEAHAKTLHKHFIARISPLSAPLPSPRTRGDEGGSISDMPWRASHTRAQYEQAVQTVIDYIHAGDIFQANLSQRFEADLPQSFDPWAHYLMLREVNAAPFAAYMNFGGVTLASSSPERFLSLHNRQIETRPIKGTTPRQSDEAIDRLYRNRLENSVKDRAENTMIVDLLRNDLSKVCEDHSVAVPQLCGLESFARVHHLVSIVRGTLRADQGPCDLLRACFPGGSITGAPKVRAMEIIEELEEKRRGPYCGAMGWIGHDGAMDTNIAIRTLVYEGNNVSFNVGGGIVADSVPAQEYEETLAKAEGLFNSFDVFTTKNTKRTKTG